MPVSQELILSHYEYSDSMMEALSGLGWNELSCEIDSSELGLDFYFGGAHGGEYSSARPTIAQFYFDLCGLRDYLVYESYADIMISRIGSGMDFLDSDEHQQEYVVYALDTPDDWETFISSLLEETALIFPGRFRRMKVAEDKFVYNAKRKNQVTLSAVCVDIDSSERGSGSRVPVSSEAASSLLESLDPALLPSYISLTGNGLHLWWVFPHMPTGGPKAVSQRRRMCDLYKAITSYVEGLVAGLPLVVDPGWINHGYRAPGSITKYGDPCRCFSSPGNPFASRVRNPVSVYNKILSLPWFDDSPYSAITEKDVSFRPLSELGGEKVERRGAGKEGPSTEKQRKYARDLVENGLAGESLVGAVEASSSKEAFALLSKASSIARRKRGKAAPKANPLPSSVNVSGQPRRVKAHHFRTGKDGGGVYRTVLDSITRVEPGRRERCLFMLAGVAYLMCDPIYTREEVERDFRALLSTDWAKAGPSPLTAYDVESALRGYSLENASRIYKKSIVSMLGFNPFSTGCHDDPDNPPQKRNGRKRAEHLALCREAYREKSRAEKVAAIAAFLREEPEASIRRSSRETGISRATVTKYWEEAREEASTPPPPSR